MPPIIRMAERCFKETVQMDKLLGIEWMVRQGSKAAREYGVWSTPRMFLLDREKRIISKPATVGELEEAIAQLKLVNKE